MISDSARIEALLPLPPATFHILVSLADENRHGYGIIQEVEARTGGALRLSAGTLYGAVARLLEQGLIAEARGRPGTDQRRRYYALTPFGREVARAEARRLTELVRMARGVGLLARKPS